MRRLAAAWRFLTIFPFPLRPNGEEGTHLRHSLWMFPVVGAILGVVALGMVWGLSQILPVLPRAAFLVGVLAVYSGGLHLDGVADCADALFTSGRSREKMLAILRDSRIGAHGAVGVFLLLLFKFSCLASLDATAIGCAALIMPLAGRCAMFFPMTLLAYVRPEGLGKLFTITYPGVLLLYGICWVMLLALAGLSWQPWLGVMLVWLGVGWGWTGFLYLRLGGATGDGYGAACELGEAAVALGLVIFV